MAKKRNVLGNTTQNKINGQKRLFDYLEKYPNKYFSKHFLSEELLLSLDDIEVYLYNLTYMGVIEKNSDNKIQKGTTYKISSKINSQLFKELFDIGYRLDLLNGELGNKNRYCIYCNSDKYNTQVGIVHRDDCIITRLRTIIRENKK